MTKVIETTDQVIDLGDVTVETKGNGTQVAPDAPLGQRIFPEGLSND